MLKLAILSALTLGVFGQEPERSPQVNRSHGSPYRELFQVAPVAPQVATVVKTLSAPAEHQPVHVEIFKGDHHRIQRGPCNMPIIVGDASLDPGILIPRTHAGHFRIRTVQPPNPCREK